MILTLTDRIINISPNSVSHAHDRILKHPTNFWCQSKNNRFSFNRRFLLSEIDDNGYNILHHPLYPADIVYDLINNGESNIQKRYYFMGLPISNYEKMKQYIKRVCLK